MNISSGHVDSSLMASGRTLGICKCPSMSQVACMKQSPVYGFREPFSSYIQSLLNLFFPSGPLTFSTSSPARTTFNSVRLMTPFSLIFALKSARSNQRGWQVLTQYLTTQWQNRKVGLKGSGRPNPSKHGPTQGKHDPDRWCFLPPPPC